MIPIECPKCGRGGNVPPDRLNARLVCKACGSVFHMDNSGKMNLGEPGSPDKKGNRHAEKSRSAAAASEFNLSETLANIPPAVKFGVPAVVLGAFLWMNFKPGPGEPDYVKSTTDVLKAVAANNKAQVLTYASQPTADAAGKWFDLVYGQLEQKKLAAHANPIATLWGGDPEKGTDIQMMVIVSDSVTNEQFPLPINVFFSKAGDRWLIDGNKTFGDAEKNFATLKK